MADLRGQELRDSYQNVVTDSGTDLNGIQNGNGADITARIVSRGSNSDGEWVRFADGTQIVRKLAINSLGSSSSDFAFNTDYPVSFSEVPTPVVAYRSPSSQASKIGSVLINTVSSTTQGQIRLIAVSGESFDTATYAFKLISIGRWK